jgi:hypothetical protein
MNTLTTTTTWAASPRRLRAVFRTVRVWLTACADAYATERAYEQLRHFPDAELRNRGLSRATLACDVCRSANREH